MKKKIYHTSLSLALLGGVGAGLSHWQLPLVYAQNSGSFIVGNSAINVRRSPSTSGEVVAQYQPGQAIDYDSILEADGYRWISYVGGSGHRNYVAIGTLDGSQSFGSLSTSASISSSSNFDFSPYAGDWVNSEGRKMTFTTDGKLDGQQLSYLKDAPNGSKLFSIVTDNPSTIPPWIFIPKGVGGEAYSQSDTSRDRLLLIDLSIGPVPAHLFYYRDEAGSAQEDQSVEATEQENKAVQDESTTEVKQANQDLLKKIEQDSSYWPYLEQLAKLRTFVNAAGEETPNLDYAFVDLDKNGSPEFILGKAGWVQAVYSLVDQEPQMVTQLSVLDGVAAVGGYRGSIALYETGEIANSYLSSHNGQGQREVYTLKADGTAWDDPLIEPIQLGQDLPSVTDKLQALKSEDFDWIAQELTPDKDSKQDEAVAEDSQEASSPTSDSPVEESSQPSFWLNLPKTGELATVLGLGGLALLLISLKRFRKNLKK